MSNLPLCRQCGSSFGTDPICSYFNTINDVDLYLGDITVLSEKVDIECPTCHVSLEKVSISQEEMLRCPQCFPKLTTRKNVRKVLEQNVPFTYEINRKTLTVLSHQNYQASKEALKTCPTCKELMHKEPLLEGSNIGIDHCFTCNHIIIDNGQLLQIHEWRKAGGEQYTPSVVRAENVEIRGEKLPSISQFNLNLKLLIPLVCIVLSIAFFGAFKGVVAYKNKTVISDVIPLYKSREEPSYRFAIKKKKEYRYSQKVKASIDSLHAFYDRYFEKNNYWDSLSQKGNNYILTTDTTALAIVFPDQYYNQITYIFKYRSFINLSSGRHTYPADIDLQISH